MADKESFDEDWNLNSMLQNLKKTDAIYNTLKNEFAQKIKQTVLFFFSDNAISNELLEEVDLFAVGMINLAETVIDKDKNYTDERLLQDYESIVKAVSKMKPEPSGNRFRETLLTLTKEMMIENFEGIFELSSTGFRLIEIEARWHIMVFELTMNNIVNHRSL